MVDVSVAGGAYVTTMASPRIARLGIEARDKPRNPSQQQSAILRYTYNKILKICWFYLSI